jgi:Uma2 family endonuclease
VSEQEFQQLALADPKGHWELHCGKVRQKPPMTAEHNDAMLYLAAQLVQQLDRREFRVRSNAGHVQRTAENYYIPDVFVVPTALVHPLLGTYQLETYATPLPLVVEVWSPSTGDYDVETKLLEYQRRGDLEIWLLHPFEHTLRAWRRQADGTYVEATYEGGSVQPASLPGVTINLDALFE